jgi:hypothetical protein
VFQVEVNFEWALRVHAKGALRDMKGDPSRGLLYTAGDDRRVCVVDAKVARILPGGILKTSNS